MKPRSQRQSMRKPKLSAIVKPFSVQPTNQVVCVQRRNNLGSTRNADKMKSSLNPVIIPKNCLDRGEAIVLLVDFMRMGKSNSLKVLPSSNSSLSNNLLLRGMPIPVLKLRDCFADHDRNIKMREQQRSEDSSNLRKRGLAEFKLSEVKLQKENAKCEINVEAITQLVIDAISLGNAASRHNRPFDLSKPYEECHAIVEALQLYTDHASPKDSLYLFYSKGLCTNLPTVTCKNRTTPHPKRCSKKRKNVAMARKPKKKGWSYVSSLSSSEFFTKMKLELESEPASVWEKKMLKIMKAGVEVDAHNWTLSEVGYILGFWLAKLYNIQEFPDESLPKELVIAKEHFLQLHGLHYDTATVTQ